MHDSQTTDLQGDTKTRILDAASALFLEGGLPALSVRAIARRAGMSTIGIYSHFQGKQGVLDALYIEGFEKVSAAMDIDLSEHGPREAIMLGMKRYIDLAEKYDAHYRLIFGEADPDYEPSPEARRAGVEAFARLIALTSSALPKDATLAEKQEFALTLWATLHGFVRLRGNAVSQLVEIQDWRPMILDAAGRQIDAALEL